MTKKKLIIGDIVLLSFFIILIILIKTEVINTIDSLVYQGISSFINPALTNIFKMITFLGSTVFIVLATIVILITLWKSRGKFFLLLIIIAMSLSSVLKLIIARPRPDVLKLVIEDTYSFPSGHTIAISTLIGFLIFLIWQEKGRLNKNLKVVLTVFLSIVALLVMLSRIYLGAHYFSDILGGIIISILVLFNFYGLFCLKK